MSETKDRRKFIDLYFPNRNSQTGVEVSRPFKPIEDFNYDLKSLDYTTPRSRANIFLDKIKAFYGSNPFVIIDANGGSIGGATLTFLESTQVRLVVSYESNPQYAKMLKRNIKAYGLGAKSIVLDTPFDQNQTSQINQLFVGAALFFDPPFLDPSVDPVANPQVKDQYIKEGIKLGELTLEEHLVALKNSIYVCAMHLPPDYKINFELLNKAGWKCGTLEGECPFTIYKEGRKQVELFIFSNLALQSSTINNHFGYATIAPYLQISNAYSQNLTSNWKDPDSPPVNILDESNAPKPLKVPTKKAFEETQSQIKSTSIPVELETKTQVTTPEESPQTTTQVELFKRPYVEKGKDWETFSRQLPTYNGNSPGSREWLQQFQRYIYIFVKGFITDDEICRRLVDSESIKKWIQAFSHQSYNPDYNYETMETIGDAILYYAFKKFLYKNYPQITPEYITNFSHHYLAKTYMGTILGRSIKINTWALVGPGANISRSIIEDITEAIFAALDILCDKIQDGLGILMAERLVSLIFSSVQLDPEVAQGPKRTLLDQYSGRLSLSPQGIYPRVTKLENQLYKVEFIYKADMGQYFKDHGFKFGPVLGEGIGKSNQIAMNRAVDETIKNLDLQGFTNAYVTQEADKNNVRKFINNANQYEELLNKIRALGYNRLVFNISQENSKLVVKLIALDVNNRKQVLATASGNDSNSLKREVINNFISS